MRVFLVWGCAVLSLSCSFVFAQNPPDDHEKLAYFDCPSTRAAPAADIGYTLLSGLITAGTAVDNPDTAEDESTPAATRIFGGLTALAAVSAVYGFIVTEKCEDAKDQLGERVRSQAERLAVQQAQGSKPSGAIACARDMDCKGDRICASGVCVEPLPKASPPPSAAPLPPSEPPAGTAAPGEPTPSIPPAPELPPLQPGAPAP